MSSFTHQLPQYQNRQTAAAATFRSIMAWHGMACHGKARNGKAMQCKAIIAHDIGVLR
jgi:hypothetical protein